MTKKIKAVIKRYLFVFFMSELLSTSLTNNSPRLHHISPVIALQSLNNPSSLTKYP